MSKLEIKNLNKSFGNSIILDDINLSVNDGEFVILVGPSGSGKSTILRLISGLDMPSSGKISIDQSDITNLPPKDRNISMVFQNYALYPHMTVCENLAFPLKIKKMEKQKIEEATSRVSEMLDIKRYLNKKPKELSGGERQRVALGRAIIREPKILLMDEPLSNLDAKLRTHMRSELLKLHKSLSNTIIYVTHDQIEALTMGDRIVVLNHGKIQQIDTPQEIYNNPKNIFVASFIGSPSINLFDLKIQGENKITLGGKSIGVNLPKKIYNKINENNLINKDLTLGIRPECLDGKNDASLEIQGKIDLIEMLGSECILYVKGDNIPSRSNLISVKRQNDKSYKVGEDITLYLNLERSHIFENNTTNKLDI